MNTDTPHFHTFRKLELQALQGPVIFRSELTRHFSTSEVSEAFKMVEDFTKTNSGQLVLELILSTGTVELKEKVYEALVCMLDTRAKRHLNWSLKVY